MKERDACNPPEILYRTTLSFKNAEETEMFPDAVNYNSKEELLF